MKLLVVVVVFAIISNLGWTVHARPDAWQDDDHRRTKIQLHLDNENENDKNFVDALTDILKDYRDAKLEDEHVALRAGENERADDEAAQLSKLLGGNLALLIESPKGNLVEAGNSRSDLRSVEHKHRHSARCRRADVDDQ